MKVLPSRKGKALLDIERSGHYTLFPDGKLGGSLTFPSLQKGFYFQVKNSVKNCATKPKNEK